MFDKNDLLAHQNASKIEETYSGRMESIFEEALGNGLSPAEGITQEGITCFARGGLAPTFSGAETFLRNPFCEDVHKVSEYDVAVVGVPYDSGTTNRSGTRLGPEGIRRASIQYSPYNPDYGIDLRESVRLCDVGDIYTIPANSEKSFNQITKGIGHLFSQKVMPVILGGDHSISFPCLRGISPYVPGKIGVIQFDRHADCEPRQMDERMHGTEWYYANTLPNVSAKNLVQIGVGGNWVKEWSRFHNREGSTMISMEDIDHYGLDKIAEIALETAWDGCEAVYLSLDIDVLDAAFCPGTGTPDFGGMLPRELLTLLRKVTAPGLCGMDVVEVSPPFDVSEITSVAAARCIINVVSNLALNQSFYFQNNG